MDNDAPASLVLLEEPVCWWAGWGVILYAVERGATPFLRLVPHAHSPVVASAAGAGAGHVLVDLELTLRLLELADRLGHLDGKLCIVM